MPSSSDERGESYIARPTPVEAAESTVEAPKALDFRGQKRVNPEDLTEGGPTMSIETTAAPPAFTAAPPPLTPIIVATGSDDPSVADTETTHLLDAVDAPPGSRAVVYLRVSSKGQVNTDYDPEGISIPAQRLACQRKAEQLGVSIVSEYIEPGRSATEMTKRIAFQQMLERIRRERDVDYVIVYKLSRFARNRIDDAVVMADLQKRGVQLISATEQIDATPVGQLMHGILAAFNEYRSREDGADIAYKMAQKARNGGTLGRAPLGYLNVTENVEGRKVNTVATDPERAPFVKLAFELYATGSYTFQDIADELKDRGLLTRATSRRPAGPVSDTKIQQMLRDRYYIGEIAYKDEIFKGRHEPLIEPSLFDLVQGVLESRGLSGERRRRYTHYLKGSLWCGHCRLERNVNRRLIQQRTVGRHGGEYWYFFCMGSQDGTCDAPFANVDNIEAAVEEHYKQIELSAEFIQLVRDNIEQTLRDEANAEHLRRSQLEDRLKALQAKEDNLLDLAADASLPSERIRQRLRELGREREAVIDQLNAATADLNAGRDAIEAFLTLLTDVRALYLDSSDETRRLLNQAIFNNLYVAHDDIIGDDVKQPLRELLAAQRGWRTLSDGLPRVAAEHAAQAEYAHHRGIQQEETALTGGLSGSDLSGLTAVVLTGINEDSDSSKTLMVDLRGFEPLTSSLRTKRATNCATGPEFLNTITLPRPSRALRAGSAGGALRQQAPDVVFDLGVVGENRTRRGGSLRRAAGVEGCRGTALGFALDRLFDGGPAQRLAGVDLVQNRGSARPGGCGEGAREFAGRPGGASIGELELGDDGGSGLDPSDGNGRRRGRASGTTRHRGHAAEDDRCDEKCRDTRDQHDGRAGGRREPTAGPGRRDSEDGDDGRREADTAADASAVFGRGDARRADLASSLDQLAAFALEAQLLLLVLDLTSQLLLGQSRAGRELDTHLPRRLSGLREHA